MIVCEKARATPCEVALLPNRRSGWGGTNQNYGAKCPDFQTLRVCVQSIRTITVLEPKVPTLRGRADEKLAWNRLPNALSAGQFRCTAFVGVPSSDGIFGSRAASRRDSNKVGALSESRGSSMKTECTRKRCKPNFSPPHRGPPPQGWRGLIGKSSRKPFPRRAARAH